MRSADCGTDHLLIRAKLSLEIQPKHKKSSPKQNKKLNLDKLKLIDNVVRLQETINESIRILSSCDTQLTSTEL